MSSHTRFQRGLVLLPAVPRLLEHPVLPALAPAQGPWACGQPQTEADEGIGSSARPKAKSGALTDVGEAAVHPQSSLERLGGGWGRCCPALGLPPRVQGLQAESGRRERLDAEIPVPGAAEEQAGVANAVSGHTVSPCKRRRRCFSPGSSNLGKMKLSIMHLSLIPRSRLARASAESPHV